MPDKLFYPFAVVLIAAMVVGALFAGGQAQLRKQPDIDPVADGYTVDGEGLRALIASPGTTVRYAGELDLAGEYAIAVAHMTRAAAPPSAGVFAELRPVYEAAFAEKPIIVTVRARAGRDNPAEQFAAAYYTAGVGDSGLKTFTLTDTFEDYSFTFTPNKPKGDPGTDFVGIWPDMSGQSKTIEIERFSVNIAP
ncbi:hypothetical protein [Robiginitomaculum antarcticum]|uniref:hypothetical protein n=1 Tax=Robiginitomaculum antarcticum TaxID=437507 RepID=UPI00036D63F0|nr:hypothetical protein [Robiginitomaculum antarcticum]